MLSKGGLTYFSAILALIFWAFLPILSLNTTNIPPFLKVGLATLFSSIGYFIYWVIKYNGKVLPRVTLPIKYMILCVVGLLGNNITFVYSMELGGGAVPYVIMNAWPICALLLNSFIFKQRLSFVDYIGSLFGIAGVLLLAFQDEEEGLVDQVAVLIAILNCFIWSIFSVLNKKFTKMPSDGIGAPLFIISIICLCIHLTLEPRIELSNKDFIFLLMLGLGPWGIAYSLWNFAVRHSNNLSSLTHLGFLAPALGLTMMVFMDYADFSITMFPAFLCIIGGCVLTSVSKGK